MHKMHKDGIADVVISDLEPIFKDGLEANRIQLAHFTYCATGQPCGFHVVVEKGMFQLKEHALYVQPDWLLPNNTALFLPWTAPQGDPSKSRLGKEGRVKAIKFNFTRKIAQQPIFSMGILLKFEEFQKYLWKTVAENKYFDFRKNSLAEIIGIRKQDPEDAIKMYGKRSNFPEFLYKTDEPHHANCLQYLQQAIADGKKIVLTSKHDGSSHTTFFQKFGETWKVGVCSRSFEYSLDDESNVWVQLARESGMLDRGLEYCKRHNVQLAVRSEIVGQKLKGSGNNRNPDANSKRKMIVYGVDDISSGRALRLPWNKEHSVPMFCKATGMEMPAVIAEPTRYQTIDGLLAHCDTIFEREQILHGKLYEGIVIRTADDNFVSCKYMNLAYDARK